MTKMSDLHPQFITHENGEKRSVLLPIDEFETLMEDIEEFALVAERREEPTRPHEEVIAELRRDGLLQD